jgi:hypothetical protein
VPAVKGWALVDVEWAKGKLENYLRLCDEVRVAVPRGEYWNDKASALNDEAELQLSTVERIVRTVTPEVELPLLPPSYSTGTTGAEKVRKALGALVDRAEADAFMTPEAPELSADRLHPLVWKSASTTWDTGQYRVSVGQAALALATHIKARARSKLNDRKLMQDVFAPDSPRPGQIRLQFLGDRDEETWMSRQLGLQLLAQGAYAGIRNVAAHADTPWAEHEAIEYLAVLSVIARWAEETEPHLGQ